MTTENRQALADGFRDGTPIGLGYFVVGFSLGIVAKYVGLSPLQGFVISLLNNASAGEYAALTVIKSDAPYFEIALLTFIANARYILMSTVLSQKFSASQLRKKLATTAPPMILSFLAGGIITAKNIP